MSCRPQCERWAAATVRLRKAFRLGLAVLVAGCALYVMVLKLIPTDWARRRLERKLSAATGQHVSIAELSFSVPAGARISGVRIARTEAGDPWLEAATVQVDLCVGDLLRGRSRPRWVEADGLSLMLKRNRDGDCPIADLIAGHESAGPKTAADSIAAFERDTNPLIYHITNCRIHFEDEEARASWELTELSGHGAWSEDHADIQELSGKLNGGTIKLAARLDRDGAIPRFEVVLKATDIGLAQGLAPVSYLAPVLPRGEGLDLSREKATVSLDVHGSGSTRRQAELSLAGKGSITVDPIALEDSPLLVRLSDLLGLDRSAKLGSLSASFRIRNRRVLTQDLTLELGDTPIGFEGWSDFDGKIEYTLADRTKDLVDQMPTRLRELLDDWRVHVDRLKALKVVGDLHSPRIELNGSVLDSSAGASGKERIREIGRQLRDELLR